MVEQSNPRQAPLVVLLNGPLGIGKSTLAEALGEALERSVSLDGDRLAALNPPPVEELVSLHETVALLFGHHLARGYDRFVINHFWSSPAELAELEGRLRALAPEVRFRCFRLTLSEEENLRRIARRQSVRVIDEREFEARAFEQERSILSAAAGDELGERFDVSEPPELLVQRMMALLGSPSGNAA